MDGFVTFLNTAGKFFVSFAGSMLIQSSILIAVLLVVDLILRKRVRAVFRYWIWMLVLVKLVLPTTLSSPTGPGYWFGDKLPSVVIEKSSTTKQSVTISPIVEPTSETALPEMDITASPLISTLPKPTAEVATESIAAIPAQQAVSLSWYGFAFLGWLAVVTAMVLLLVQRVVFVSGLIAQAKSAGNLMTDVFEYCCGQMGLKCKVGLKVSANATSPAVCGLFRPVILVPGDLAPSLGASRLRAVLLHELAHIKRGDLWVSLVQTVLQIVYFYNPLLWVANFMIRRVREQAVDEAVQVAMGERAREYPQTLVEVAKLTFKRPTLSLRLTGVVESKSALKGRIKRMLGRPIPRSAKLGIAGLLAVIVAGAVLLPMAGAEKSKETTEVAQQQSEFKATLSNGVTVELLGICQYPSEGKQWWRPDGTLLEQVIVTEDNSNYTSKGKTFEIAYKINAPNDITVGWPHIRGSTAQSGLIVKEPGGIKAVRVHINKWGSTTTIGFGIADGEWTLLGKADGKGQTYSSIGSRKLMFGPAINTGNKITLTVSDTLESNNDYRLIAVDKLGKIIEATRNWFSVERLRQSTFTFTNLSQDIIDHFEFQSRPYKLVEFKNVSLKPNFKTDVEIEVEKPAVQVEGEARDVRAEKMSSLPGSEQKNITIQAKVFSVKSNTDAVRDFLANKLKLNGVSTDKPWLEPAILTDIEADNFSNYMSLQPDVSLLVSPKVRAFDGEKAEMQVTDRDEYVTGYEAGKPKKEEFVTGVEFSFTPKLRRDNKAVTLKVDFKKTDLVEVVKKTDELGREINIPMIDIQSVSTTVVVPEGNSILIPVAGMQRPVADSATTCQIILLVKADVQVESARTKEISDADKMVSEDLAAEGWALWRQRKLAEAEKVFKETVAKDPTNGGAWNGLGWSQLNRGKRLNAKVSFQKCVEIEPNQAAALNGLGWIAKGEKKIDEAIGYWEKAVESAPGATAALSGLTQTYMELKQYDNAIKYYQMWLKVEPDNAQAKTGLEKAKVEKATGWDEGDISEKADESQVKTIAVSVLNEEAGAVSVFDFSTEKTTDIKLNLDKFALKERIDRFFQAFFASDGDISFKEDNDILLMNSGRIALLSLEQLSDAFQISLDKLIAHIRAVDLEDEEMSRVPSFRVGTLKIGQIAVLMTGDGIVAAIEGGQFDAESQKREIKYIILGQVDINDLPEPQFLVGTEELIAESMVEKAAYALANDDLVTAQFLAKNSAELKPELTDALLVQGMVCVKKGEYDKAREFYERALEVYKSTNNFNRQSLVLKLLGRDSEAEAPYSKIDPNFKEPISVIFNDKLKPMDFVLPADKAASEAKKEK